MITEAELAEMELLANDQDNYKEFPEWWARKLIAEVRALRKVAEAAANDLAWRDIYCDACDNGVDGSPCTCFDIIRVREDLEEALKAWRAGGE